MIRTYSELSQIDTFRERYEYLRLRGRVGTETFGYDRYLNQKFYGSREWKSVRQKVIIRDNGCDLGIEGYDIFDRILIHHMNPIAVEDFRDVLSDALNPEYLISVTHNTHNAIHYSDASLLPSLPMERFRNDTAPWKQRREARGRNIDSQDDQEAPRPRSRLHGIRR